MVRHGSLIKELFGGPGPATGPYEPFTETQKEEILESQGHECAREGCGTSLKMDMAYFAQLVPPSQGGKHVASNCEALCPHHYAEKTRLDRE